MITSTNITTGGILQSTMNQYEKNYSEETDKIIEAAIYAGQIILESGGETHRAEKAFTSICESFDAKQCGAFVTPTGIIASFTTKNSDTISKVKRVHKYSIHLEKVALVHNLCKKIKSRKLPIIYINKQLKQINKAKNYPFWLILIASSTAAATFSVLFKGNLQEVIAAFFCGCIIRLLKKLFEKIKMTDFFINVIGGFIATIFAYLFSYIIPGTTPEPIIMGAIMLLVPGLAITNAIRDTIAGDLVAGTSRAVNAFFVAVAIAVGSGIALKIVFTITELK